MAQHLIFLQGGGGQEDYDGDATMVASLKAALGPGYTIHYPPLPNEDLPDYGRREQIGRAIADSKDPLWLVAHSLGASMLLNYLSENVIRKGINGIFLLATPFWSGDEDWVQPLKLQRDFESKLDKAIPLFFYHCKDDEEVPFAQFAVYKQAIPWARFRELPAGGHQFNNDLSVIAADIRNIGQH